MYTERIPSFHSKPAHGKTCAGSFSLHAQGAFTRVRKRARPKPGSFLWICGDLSERRQSEHYIQPPETFITCAVTYFDSSEAR